VIEDACRAIDANNSLTEAWARMNAAEVWRVQSGEILG
jgi:nicotinamidase/pyrazinamidase